MINWLIFLLRICISSLLISALFNTTDSQECEIDLIKDANFICECSLNNTVGSLYCKSDTLSESEIFFILQLYRPINKFNSGDLFTSFLNSEHQSSSFSRCVPAITNSCSRKDYCIAEVFQFIEASFVRNINITNTKINFADFQPFTSLVTISVLDSILYNFSEVYFLILPTLQDLVLRNNSIQYFPAGAFKFMVRLKFIDLSINRLKDFSEDTFGTLEKLKHLNLSRNSIQFISNDTFKGFPNLEELYLTDNDLTMIDENTFNFNRMLNELDISYNNLTVLPQKVFSKLTNLKRIICKRCHLGDLDQNLFSNTPNLLYVDFSENNIKHLPTELFRNQHLLDTLNLNSNSISHLNPFINKTRLRNLCLSENNISSLKENVFWGTPNLFWIDISANKLSDISDKHIHTLKSVGLLNLSENNLTVIELGKKVRNKIRHLKLSNNRIKKFDVHWHNFAYLELLDLRNNEINYLDLPPCIQNVKQTITFYFQYNKITRIGLKSLLKDEERAQTDRKMGGCLFNGLPKNFIDLTHNPLVCDCEIYPLYEYIKSKRRIKLDGFLNIDKLACESPSSLKNALIRDVPEDVFSCNVTNNCPDSCSCGIRGQDNKTFINCTNAGLHEAPQNIPIMTTVLYFNHNHLDNMLSLNSWVWKNLTEIYINNNCIYTLEGWEVPPNLRYLSLQGNKIENIPNFLANFISNQSDFQLLLSNNDTNCDCKKKSLKKFLVKNTDVVKDIAEIICQIDNNGTKSFLQLYKTPDSILCPKVFVRDTFKRLVIWLCLSFLFLIIMVLVYYKQRQLILSHIFIHCEQLLKIFCEESDYDEEKTFDGFIAYSSSDRAIVMNLLQELEEKEPYFKLCIHERDWLPGRYISDNIIHSVQSSKRTIIVLSDSFISSPWFRLELRAAVFKVSKDKMNKIIVILADSSTSLDGIDTELRHVITKRTYLVWGERWFWEKLRYAMPHKSFDANEHNTAVSDSRRQSSEMMLINNEVNVSNSVIV